MDGLIVLFIIIGIVNALGSSKKKRERQAKEAQRRAFREAEQSREAAPPTQRAQLRREKREAVEAHRVRTSAELQAHLAAMEASRSGEEARGGVAAPSGESAFEYTPLETYAQASNRRAREPKPAEPQVVAPTQERHGGEGATSTQGETPEEHAEHLRRVAAEEQAHRLEREALRDLRNARREKLQSAVIMSEILNKPVSLRARTGLHR